jgi:hypothetical protein
MFVGLLLDDVILARNIISFLFLSELFHDFGALLHVRLIVLLEPLFLVLESLLVCNQHFVTVNRLASFLGKCNNLLLCVDRSLLRDLTMEQLHQLLFVDTENLVGEMPELVRR